MINSTFLNFTRTLKIVVSLAFIALNLSACSTMEFVNGPKIDDTVVREKWHHFGFEGLIEYSKPLDITYYCGPHQQWDSITVERTFLNELAGLTPYGISIYSPWSIVYECRDPID